MKIKLSNDYNFNLIENNKDLLFISCLLLLIPCGLRLNVFPFITYIFYFPVLAVVIYALIRNSRYIITAPIIFGLIVISYLWITQLQHPDVDIAGIFTKTATVSFYVLVAILFPRLSTKKNFYICDIMLLVYLIFHSLDTLFRIIMIKFNIIRMFTDIYSSKDLTFMAADTNMSGFLTLILTFFSYYLYSITRKNKYKIFGIAFFVLTIFSCSRSAWIALGVTTVYVIFYSLVKDFFKSRNKRAIYIASLKSIIFVILFSITLWTVYNIIIFVQEYLSHDGSFGTKMRLYHDTMNFLQTAPNKTLYYGTGFQLGRRYTSGGVHTHTFFTTFIMETGLYGTSLMLMFFFSVFLHARKTILLLMPFFVCSIGFAYLSALFYASLGIIDYFENYYEKKGVRI